MMIDNECTFYKRSRWAIAYKCAHIYFQFVAIDYEALVKNRLNFVHEWLQKLLNFVWLGISVEHTNAHWFYIGKLVNVGKYRPELALKCM